jgi:hypothetical protein
LGPWYATALFWRPQVALLVNESTLLPVLMPLAPAATLPARAGGHIAEVLALHDVSRQLVADEEERMRCAMAEVSSSRDQTSTRCSCATWVAAYPLRGRKWCVLGDQPG